MAWPTQLASRATTWIVRARLPVLVAVALVSWTAFQQTDRLQLDSSNESFLMEGDGSLRLMNEFKDLFGNDDFVFILHEAEDAFQLDTLRRLAALAEDLEAAVPHLYELTWLGNAEWIQGREESLEIEPLMDPLPETAEALALARERALAEPSFVNTLISPNGRVAGLLLEMDLYPEDGIDPRKDVAPVVREIIARPEHADLDLVAVGGPIVDYDLDILTIEGGQRLGLVCLAIQIAILMWVGQGIRGVLVPVAVICLSLACTFGAIAMMGTKLNMAVMMVPVLLICVGIGDSMHVISEINGQRRRGLEPRAAGVAAMGVVAWPCLLTSVTTSMGFLAFLASDIKPFRDMGVYAAMGVMVTLALTFLIVPAVYSYGRRGGAKPADAPARQDDVFDRLLVFVARLVRERPGPLIGTFATLLVVSAVGYTLVEVDTSIVRMFSEDVPLRRDHDWVDARMGGTMSLELMLDSGEPEGVLDPEFLRDMEALEQFIASNEHTTQSSSILDVLRMMRRAFFGNSADAYVVPKGRDEAAQYLLLYDVSGGEQREQLIATSNDVARLTARTRSLGTSDTRGFIDEVTAFVERELGDTMEVGVTGTMAWAEAMSRLISRGQRHSFAAALVAITLMMIVVLRSPWLGLISMIPNVFPVLVAMALMGYLGLSLDLMTMAFSAVIIGVAVDDSIHFFVRFRREFERVGDYGPAIEATLQGVGRPIVFTTMTLSLGFAALLAADVASLQKFGLLSGFAFTWALIADFLFAPALLMVLKPLGPGRAGS